MNKIKEVYSQPTAELLVVRFEENVCIPTYTRGGGGKYEDDEIYDNGEY